MFCQTCGTQMSPGARFCPKCGSGVVESPIAPSDAYVGRTIEGRYRIESKLGSGGMGAVYRATRLLIGDTVAFKILRPETMADPQAVERFRREAQAAARLKHPNVVAIHDFGVAGGDLVYLVMELADGEDLRSLVERLGPLQPKVAAELMEQLCSALEEAHQRNIVHRDLKPDNILVRTTPRGFQVKVLDFGIAKIVDATTGSGGTLTKVGTVMGTPTYMSPEQCLGSEVDSRSDIYSLGVILYELLTGTVPFRSREASALVVQHVNDAPPPPRLANASIPPAVEAVVMRALEKRRDLRQQTAGEFARELDAAVRAPAQPVTVAVSPAHAPISTVPVHAVSTDPRAPVAPPTVAEHHAMRQPTVPAPPPMMMPQPMMTLPAPPRPSSGVPAVLKVAGALMLLVVGVAVGFAVKYLLEQRSAPPAPVPVTTPTPPPTNTQEKPAVSNKPATPPVQLPGNVSDKPATPPPSTGARYGRVSGTRVTLRDRPSIGGSPKNLLNPNDRVEILGEQENTSTREGVLVRDSRFAGEGAGDPAELPQGRGVVIVGEQGDEFRVETTHGGRRVRGYVPKSAVGFSARLWYRVRSASGDVGWVNSQFVTVE
jgi:serine/threonine protein kinase